MSLIQKYQTLVWPESLEGVKIKKIQEELLVLSKYTNTPFPLFKTMVAYLDWIFNFNYLIALQCSGYMSPEYAMQGLFSDKSDVFSFGVLLLEIISGRRNSSFYDCDSLTLLGFVSLLNSHLTQFWMF